MIRPAALSLAVSLACIGPAFGQSCLAVADGAGGTAVTCPDGRTGFLHSDGNGVTSGMIGTDTFAAPSAALPPPLSLDGNRPSMGSIAPPPPSLSPSPASEPLPMMAPSLPRIEQGLTPLQQEYLRRPPADLAAP